MMIEKSENAKIKRLQLPNCLIKCKHPNILL